MEPGGLYNASHLVIALLTLSCIGVGAEFGRWLGARVLARRPTASGTRVASFENAILGMLSLMIGFTFSLALNRFEQRKGIVLSEANAIGTVLLRARFLPDSNSAQVKRVARDYVDVRMTLGNAAYGSEARAHAIETSLRAHEALWREAVAVTSADPRSVPAGLFADAVNHLIDMHEIRVTADRNHVPGAALALLFGLATVAMGFAGYTNAISATRSRIAVAVMAVTIVTVLTFIMDLDRPRRGFMTVSQQPMLDLRAGM